MPLCMRTSTPVCPCMRPRRHSGGWSLRSRTSARMSTIGCVGAWPHRLATTRAHASTGVRVNAREQE
eukprot:1777222-Alexandrium_andersonii.AAC.1